MTETFETLHVEVADGVAVLTLARPSRRNAINSQMNTELPLAWRKLEADPDVRAIIVTGAGDKAFCTGADLADLPATKDPLLATQLASIAWTGRQNAVSKPVIAAINGLTVGAGLHYLADADIVLSVPHAQFIDTHVAVGLLAALEPIGLSRRMPLGAVMKLALTGGDERLDAAELHRLGLIDELLPPEGLMPRARQLAASIARHSPTAVARTRAAIWRAQELALDDALEEGWRLIRRQSTHPDMAEGVAAFIEKRAPRWADREPGDLD